MILMFRIDQRVLDMIDLGLVEEVKSLQEKHIKGQALQAIGYKELLPYLEGNTSIDEAIELIKRNSRRYAKRQITWFKNKMDVTWFKLEENNFSEVSKKIIEYIKKEVDR